MEDLFGILCVLGFLLTVVTVIGHGLWLLLAKIQQAIIGESPLEGRPCESCGSPRGVVGSTCKVCGVFTANGPFLRERMDLIAAKRLLVRMRARGRISEKHYDQLRSFVDKQLHELGATSGESVETAAPISPPPITLSRAIEPAPVAESPTVKDVINSAPDQEIVTAELIPEPAPRDALIAEESAKVVREFVPVVPREPAVTKPPAPAAPPPALADVLQAFMEEKNIRWGELLSGILIVVSAVGLVISLRATLKDAIPYFPAFMFMLVTAAIHFAGVYSLRRWNLKSTSRGVLIIATLLIPLNFLAAVILSGSGEQLRSVSDPLYWVAIFVGLLSFGTMNYFAARSLLRVGWWRLMVSVLGTSIGQVTINRLTPPDLHPLGGAVLLALPISAYMVAMIAAIHVHQRRKRFTQRGASMLFLEGALATFALLAPLGLLLSKLHSWSDGFANLSPTLSVIAGVVLAWGLVVHVRATALPLSGYRTAGTSIAIFGAGLLAMMVVLAWPQPHLLIAVGLVNAALLIGLAITANLPILNIAAIGCLALATLVGFHFGQHAFEGNLPPRLHQRMVEVLLLGRSSIVLTFFAAAVGGVGIWLSRRLRKQPFTEDTSSMTKDRAEVFELSHPTSILIASAMVAVVGLAGAIYAGFFAKQGIDTQLITPLLMVYFVAAFGVPVVVNRKEIAWLASGVMFLAIVHATAFNDWTREHWFHFSFVYEHPVVAAAVLHSLLATIIAAATAWQMRAELAADPSVAADVSARAVRWREFIDPFCWSAILSSTWSLPFACWVTQHHFGTHGGYMAAIAGVWFVVALLQRQPIILGVGQALATLAVGFITTAICLQRAWWDDWWFDPRFLQTQFVVLAICSVMASVLRQLNLGGLEKWLARVGCPTENAFLSSINDEIAENLPKQIRWATVDQIVFGGIVRAFCVMGLIACYPGTCVELGMIDVKTLSEHARMFATYASGGGSWIVCVVLLMSLGIFFRERQSRITIAGMLFVLATIPLLIAARFDGEVAVASALRWAFAIYAAILAVPACRWGGERMHEAEESRVTWQRRARVLRWFAVSTGVPFVVLLTTAMLMQVTAGAKLGGPAIESIFKQMGSTVSYGVPLGLLVAVTLAFAIRQGKPGYALAGSALFQYLVSLSCVLPAITATGWIEEPLAIPLLQWNGIALAVYAWIGIAARRWIERTPIEETLQWGAGSWLDVQLILAIIVNVFLVAIAACPLVCIPGVVNYLQPLLGAWPSYGSLVAFISLGGWYVRRGSPGQIERLAAVSAAGMVAIAAVSLHVWDGPARWCGYHSLFVGWTMVAVALAFFACWQSRHNDTTVMDGIYRPVTIAVRWATGLCGLIVFGAIRGVSNDPEAPWWSCGWAVSVMLITTALGVRGRSQQFAYVSTSLAGLGVLLFWIGSWNLRTRWDFVVESELICAAILLAACFWLVVEIWYQKKRNQPFDIVWRGLTVHQTAAIVGTALAFLWFWSRVVWERIFFFGWNTSPPDVPWIGGVALLITLGILLATSLWERKSRHTLFCLYCFGMTVGVFTLHVLAWDASRSIVAVGIGLATYVAFTGQLWNHAVVLSAIGHRCGVPDPVAGLKQVARWLPIMSLLLTTIAGGLALLVVLNESMRELRTAAALCPFLCAAGLVRLAQKQWRPHMQFLSLLLLVVAAVLMGWADIGISMAAETWLTRVIRLVMVLAAATVLYGAVLMRTLPASSDWRDVVRRVAVSLGGGAIVTLLLVLGMEASLFVPGKGAPVDDAQVVAVSVVLITLVVGLLSMAILPERDPFALTETGRTAYVYAAQIVAALILAHVYMAKPFWFDGVLKPWWPYILMAIAFGGVGVGELFQRMGWRVLAEPLQKTGAFLPLLPLIGMWAVSSDSDYAMVLLVMGLLYAMLSITRRSWLSGVAAGLAGNGALWAFLFKHTDITLWARPQFWLIPPAVSVLVAAQLNRNRLSNESLTAVRYLCMLVIYISSTSEIFITGIGESLWPPMILATLAISGVFVGIALQVRAFLYMGCSFVLLAMISMVWHASRSINHSWPWWAFGFLSGLAILVFFGLFEKKREEIMRLVERIREWEK